MRFEKLCGSFAPTHPTFKSALRLTGFNPSSKAAVAQEIFPGEAVTIAGQIPLSVNPGFIHQK